MSPVQKAGLYYPNKFGLITIKSLEEVMGRNGLNAILNLAGLNHYIENYPPDNLEKGYVVLMSVGEEAVLTALAREHAKLGLILLDMRRATEDLSKLI